MKNIYIDEKISKEPYIKKLSDDKVINITGESGSGKSYYTKQFINNDKYIVIDTDLIFSDMKANEETLELRKIFKNDSKEILFNDFDNFYLKVLNYFKNTSKTIVIDSAQFRNIKDIKIIKGYLIVMRTDIDTCYKRCINRYKNNHPNSTAEEIAKFKTRKKEIYKWYHSLNGFLIKIDNNN